MSGVCVVCHCTDLRACVRGDRPCAWVNDEHDLCSACAAEGWEEVIDEDGDRIAFQQREPPRPEDLVLPPFPAIDPREWPLAPLEIPPIVLSFGPGTKEPDFNRSVAEAQLRHAEEQVFEPARAAFGRLLTGRKEPS